MEKEKPPILSLFRCYSTTFLNARQDYLNKHMSKDGIDHGGHTMEAATAEACKTVAQNQRDAIDVVFYEDKIIKIWDAVICPMCYRLNPHHADENKGRGCNWCQEKEHYTGQTMEEALTLLK